MLMFSSKSKPGLTEFIGPMSPTQSYYRSDAINPHNLPYRTPSAILPKQISQEIFSDEPQTSKTARPVYGYYMNTNSPFPKSINTTPEKDRNKQNISFTGRSKFK